MRLFLDDKRATPPGWFRVYNIEEAKAALAANQVEEASLDHDLGACDDCRGGLSDDEWLAKHNYQAMPNCEHFGTGYQLCLWMAETGHWPKTKPRVHSANPVGRARMQGVIDRYFGTKEGQCQKS